MLRFTEDRSLGALAGLVRLEFGSMGKRSIAEVCTRSTVT